MKNAILRCWITLLFSSLLIGLVTLAPPAGAMLIDIGNLSDNLSATVSDGTIAVAITAGGTGSGATNDFVTYTYTVSDLDLGGAPGGDSVSGTITLTASGGTNPRVGVANVRWGVITDEDTAVWLQGTSEKLRVAATSQNTFNCLRFMSLTISRAYVAHYKYRLRAIWASVKGDFPC